MPALAHTKCVKGLRVAMRPHPRPIPFCRKGRSSSDQSEPHAHLCTEGDWTQNRWSCWSHCNLVQGGKGHFPKGRDARKQTNKQTNKRWTLQYHWGYTSHPLAVLAGFVGNHLLPPFYIINLLFKLLLWLLGLIKGTREQGTSGSREDWVESRPVGANSIPGPSVRATHFILLSLKTPQKSYRINLTREK